MMGLIRPVRLAEIIEASRTRLVLAQAMTRSGNSICL
jgi:hypothetical protein